MIVSFEVPAAATRQEALEYTNDAVRCMRGALQPPGSDDGAGGVNTGDPMFELNADTVKVRFVRRPKAQR
jgi:hypothetical protein